MGFCRRSIRKAISSSYNPFKALAKHFNSYWTWKIEQKPTKKKKAPIMVSGMKLTEFTKRGLDPDNKEHVDYLKTKLCKGD